VIINDNDNDNDNGDDNDNDNDNGDDNDNDECIYETDSLYENYIYDNGENDDSQHGFFGDNEFCSECGYNDIHSCICGRYLCGYCGDDCDVCIKKNKTNELNLKILGYNLFYGENTEQIDYINTNNYDILFLSEASKDVLTNFKNYNGYLT
jgi:hypothetical protein